VKPPPEPAPVAPVSAPEPATASAPAAARAPKAPRFTVKEEIGRGPLGVVHKAQDTVDKKVVAMRVLPPSAPHAKHLVADLKAASGIAHPSFVRVVILSDVKGQRAIVNEYIHGTTLSAAVESGQKLSVGQVHGIARVVAEALAVAHAGGLAHGSIQPSNLMIATGGLRIADLGLGRLHLALVPSSPFRAPEGRLDAEGDVYALGATLRFLLANATAKPAGSPELPPPFDTLLPRCLDRNPQARPKASEIATILAAKR
jgi:serine/threonine-protein kinase